MPAKTVALDPAAGSTESEFPYDVFLSHSTVDGERIAQIARHLESAGLRVWYHTIDAGEHILKAIEEGLANSRVTVMCLSPAALRSPWVSLERYTVIARSPMNEDGRFIPVLLEECEIPATLSGFNYIDYRQESDSALAELVRICRAPSRRPVVGVGSTRALTAHSVWPFTAASALLLAAINTGIFVANYISPSAALLRYVVLTAIWSAILTLALQATATLLIITPPYQRTRMLIGQHLIRLATPVWLFGIGFGAAQFFSYTLYVWNKAEFAWTQDIIMVVVGLVLIDRWGLVRESVQTRLQAIRKVRLNPRAAAAASVVIAAVGYWLLLWLYTAGYVVTTRYTAEQVNRVNVTWSQDGRSFDASLAGLLFPTLCFLEADAGDISHSTESRLEGRHVRVIANGDLTSASAKGIGCMEVKPVSRHRSLLGYHIRGDLIGDVPKGRVIYCEAVAWRAKDSPDEELEFDILRAQKCSLDSIYHVH